jgi:DNA-binding response OmpR family regulator
LLQTCYIAAHRSGIEWKQTGPAGSVDLGGYPTDNENMPLQRILTIEDDAAIRRGIVDALRYVGYETLESGRGRQGMEMALSCQFDLLPLDLVLPECDGLEILREVRRLRPTMPVIILTARGDEADRVLGLRGGADDYVVKPFSVKELLARVEAVLRRSAERPSDVAQVPSPAA